LFFPTTPGANAITGARLVGYAKGTCGGTTLAWYAGVVSGASGAVAGQQTLTLSRSLAAKHVIKATPQGNGVAIITIDAWVSGTTIKVDAWAADVTGNNWAAVNATYFLEVWEYD
jgi:hypothetical protein